jgi:hypothetical protein
MVTRNTPFDGGLGTKEAGETKDEDNIYAFDMDPSLKELYDE